MTRLTVQVFRFSFRTKHFPQLGYFIEAINGVRGEWQQYWTYWQISNITGPLDKGIQIVPFSFRIFFFS